MPDVEYRIVVKRLVNGEVEPDVIPGTAPEEVAKDLVGILRGHGIGSAEHYVERLAPGLEYTNAVVFALVKAYLGAGPEERDGVLDIPVVILDTQGRGVEIEYVPVETNSAEELNQIAWRDWVEAVSKLKDLGIPTMAATQIVDEVVKFLF
jgi:hypothetical protein